MSKTSLKKELSSLDRDQLIDVILTAYSSSKPIKEYFDFFADPDIDRLCDRHKAEITKEILRGKYRKSTARISRLRSTLRHFESFNPGPERVRDLRLWTIAALIDQEMHKEYSDTLINGTLRLLNDTILYSDRNLIFDTTISAVNDLLKERNDRSRYFRKFLRNHLQLPQ